MGTLHDAVTAGDLASVESQLKSVTSIDEKNSAGETALLLAVRNDRTEIAKALMAAGASINARAKNKDTPWLLAGASGRTEILKAMIPLGPDLSIRNRYGGNALIPACERGHVDTIRLLLTTAIDVNHVNNLGWTCLLEIVILGRRRPAPCRGGAAGARCRCRPQSRRQGWRHPLAHARAKGQIEVAALIEKAGGRL